MEHARTTSLQGPPSSFLPSLALLQGGAYAEFIKIVTDPATEFGKSAEESVWHEVSLQ